AWSAAFRSSGISNLKRASGHQPYVVVCPIPPFLPLADQNSSTRTFPDAQIPGSPCLHSTWRNFRARLRNRCLIGITRQLARAAVLYSWRDAYRLILIKGKAPVMDSFPDFVLTRRGCSYVRSYGCARHFHRRPCGFRRFSAAFWTSHLAGGGGRCDFGRFHYSL